MSILAPLLIRVAIGVVVGYGVGHFARKTWDHSSHAAGADIPSAPAERHADIVPSPPYRNPEWVERSPYRMKEETASDVPASMTELINKWGRKGTRLATLGIIIAVLSIVLWVIEQVCL